MSRKNGYKLTTANLREQPLSQDEYCGQRMEDYATAMLESNKKNREKRKRGRK